VNQFCGLVLNGFHDFRVAMACRTDCDASIAIQKYVSIYVFHPNAGATLSDEFERRPRVCGINKLGVRFDNLLPLWTWQCCLDFRTARWCEYAARHDLFSLSKTDRESVKAMPWPRVIGQY
jgi:hypothetical protein